MTEANLVAEIEALGAKLSAARVEVNQRFIGQDRVVELVLAAMLCGGHALLVGLPGLGKTLLVDTLGTVMGLRANRIQFTPDLMPADILGSEVLDGVDGSRSFRFIEGPIFCELLMADEINRASPRTQSALLQAMQEREVTIAGQHRKLGPPFHVLATQNPIEQEGTYPLPEAQLDRFLFKLLVPYPSAAEEARIVSTFGLHAGPARPADMGITEVADAATIAAAAQAVKTVTLAESVIDYIVRLVRATRESGDLSAGASPRAAVLLANAARARAAIEMRDYVLPDDVKALAASVLRHRLLLSPAAEIEGKQVEALVAELVDATEAPR